MVWGLQFPAECVHVYMVARILVVDDNEIVRAHISETLKAHDGWEVCAEVENGVQAVAKARELNPDLIILDLAMPVMDGLMATREITKILPSVPIIIYTLHYAEWVELEAKKAGARAAVRKSDVTRLLDLAEDLLGKNPPVESAPAVLPFGDVDLSETLATFSEPIAIGSQDAVPPLKGD